MTVVHAKPPQDFSFARAPRVMVIESRFYDSIADMLLVGAKKILETSGASYEVFTVPGALEVPAAIKFALSSGYDAYVILGCVIRAKRRIMRSCPAKARGRSWICRFSMIYA